MKTIKRLRRINGFRPGDRVKMTGLAFRYNLAGEDKTARCGTVSQVHIMAPYIDVLRDGHLRGSKWHISFWKRSNTKATSQPAPDGRGRSQK